MIFFAIVGVFTVGVLSFIGLACVIAWAMEALD